MKYKNNFLQISCDGGAATGKSTGAMQISKKYKLKFLSSGLLYRYASFLILKNQPKNISNFLKKKFKNLNYNKLNKINLHNPRISEHSAKIAKIYKVRWIVVWVCISHIVVVAISVYPHFYSPSARCIAIRKLFFISGSLFK